MPPPELPAQEALKGRVGLVHKGATPLRAEALSLKEVSRLVVVENVALSIIGGRAARSLVPVAMMSLESKHLLKLLINPKCKLSLSPECGAALYGEGLVSVHKGFTDGKTHSGGALEMDTHKGA